MPKIVSEKERRILENKFEFYNRLDAKRKSYFEYRVAKFISHYQFVSKEDLVVTDEMKLMIAGTSVKVTFGMRKYLLDVFDKIILYPNIYYSTINDAWHKGEFNPRMKALVFSWQNFLDGYEYSNDNLKLGIHEFAHAVHMHGLKRTSQFVTVCKNVC